MIKASWNFLLQLSPWLIIGTLLSGLLFILLPVNLIRRKFQGWHGIWKAVGFGVPLPLCSCGVIPAGIGLKRQGASDSAAVGFLISTPQTGVDSILVSASFFGWPFALMKMVAAAVIGLTGGWVVESTSAQKRAPESASGSGGAKKVSRNLASFIEHCVEILRSIWLWLLVGIVVSAAIEVWVPESWFTTVSEMGVWPSMFLSLALATPLYVCATASVPIAASLVMGGLSPAAAMVFLMAGPATNVSTIGAIKTEFGWRVTAIYLFSILGGSLVAGWMFASMIGKEGVVDHLGHQHHHSAWEQGSAMLVLAAMVYFAIETLVKKYQHRRARLTVTGGELTVFIDGMHCQSCAGKLQSGLQNIDGVESVRVELRNDSAILTGEFDMTTVEETVKNLGFVWVDSSNN